MPLEIMQELLIFVLLLESYYVRVKYHVVDGGAAVDVVDVGVVTTLIHLLSPETQLLQDWSSVAQFLF